MEKEKFQLEFEMKSVPVNILWSYIATSNGLAEWFADEVKISGKTYLFNWNGQEQSATQVQMRTGVSIRLRWDDDTTRNYFEMRISVNELTDSTTLTITDFADSDEIDDAKELWITQIDSLRRIIGC